MTDILDAVTKERIKRGGLWEFVKTFWNVVESCELVEEPHMRLVCRSLDESYYRASRSFKPADQPWMDGLRGDIPEMVIACPPGISKSLLTSVMAPAWAWTWCPQLKVISTSYSEMLVFRDAKRSFEIMTSDLYLRLYPHVDILGGERASTSFYTNSKRGMRYAVSQSGQITGVHGHIVVFDDPVKTQDLQGDAATALEKVVEKYDHVFSSRSADPETFTRVVIAQRLHYSDLSGVLIERGAHHVCLPMEFEPERAYSSHLGSDWRTHQGELLVPKRFPLSVCEARKAVLPLAEWSGQYQQNPLPADGAMFQREWFQNRYVGTPWGSATITLSVDSSHKDSKGADYTVILAGARVGPKFYVVDVMRGRMGFSDQVRSILQMRSKWANVGNILIEAKANGEAITESLRRQITGVIPVHPKGGKESRAAATQVLWNSGCVLLPEKAPWVENLIEEHVKFPLFTHDDVLDACTQWLTWSSAQDRNQHFKAAMSKARSKMSGFY